MYLTYFKREFAKKHGNSGVLARLILFLSGISGTRGTVKVVDDIGTVHCEFDSGRNLGLIDGEDDFRPLTAQKLAEEESAQGEDNSPVLTM